MLRKIIRIDDSKCDGCGLCADACHEGAIGLVDGKAKLLRDGYCDGLGDCMPVCPAGAISFEEREAAEYEPPAVSERASGETHLNQWPVQIRLVPPNAPCFNGANLLIAADSAAYACGDFHNRFMKNRITIIGCPKLDEVDYSEKLTSILQSNEIKSVMIARMEVPCCAGIENATKIALQNCGKKIPLQVVILPVNGKTPF